ncbi:hypothetical protein ACO1O0_008387 [Amphichorda felina]
MSSRINKACDGCRVRKVKCSGALPCSQCAHLDLPCHFSPPSGKRKPGVRNRLVEQLREQNAHQPHQPHQPYGSYPPLTPTVTSAVPAVTSVAGIINPDLPATSPSTSSTTTTESYSPDFFIRLLPDFEAIVYPVSPIITPDELRDAISTMHATHEDAALVYGFAAVTINLSQTSSWTIINGDVSAQVTDLMQRSLAAHRMADLGPGPGPMLGELSITVKRIMTCIFLEISMMAFRLFQRSFVILREAISLLQSLKIFQYPDTDDLAAAALDRREIARRQRLYWECFIHERFVNIMSGCPSVLPPLSTGPPIPDPSIPPYVDLGFRRLLLLFAIMDDSFLSHWNAQQDPGLHVPEPMTAQWIEHKQAELDRHEADTAAEEDHLRSAQGTGLTELQHADLFVTRLWLRTLVWQLALSNRLLCSALPETAHQGLSLHFPANRLSAQLRSLVSRLESVASIGTHGSGILQKLFEVTTTVADVLALPPGQTATQEDVKARMEDFLFLVGFLFRFERISKEEREYMRQKLEVLQHLYTVVDFGNLAVRSA